MRFTLKSFRPLLLVAFSLVLLAGVAMTVATNRASALSGSQFTAGRIMDDAVFFSTNTMTPSDIQAFLNAKVPTCDTNGTLPHGGTSRAAYGTSVGNPPPYTCLKDYAQAIPNTAADTYCPGGIGGGTKSAALIIYEVGQACNVNPKVLLVLLEKEQGLVTDDWPWPIEYRSATGYGCPDSAPCDTGYYGFFNQVYNAAHQFQRYAQQPQLFNYRGGTVGYIQYNPNAGCGGTNIGIVSQATAGLYNYTPYQPNQAALNNLYGTGDSCSSYGNRNFWRMYTDWFGSSQTTVPFAYSLESKQVYADAARTQPFNNTATTVPGGTVYVTVRAQNMGLNTWTPAFVRLGTSRPNDRGSRFYDSSWPDPARPTQLLESSVAPGQIGTFQFAMKAPPYAGTFTEPFNLVAEGVTWMNDNNLSIKVNVNTAAPVSNIVTTTMTAWQTVNVDDYLMSPDSQTVLALQRDGNLVEYSNFKGTWSSGTYNNGTDAGTSSRLVMQGDGNLVLYSKTGAALWNSQTSGYPGARLVMQTDGNIVIYSASNVALWWTGTTQNPDHLSYINNIFPSGRMYAGQSITTADRRFRLVLQGDGNLVLYAPNRVLWATGTDGRPVAFLAMQGDGQLALYDRRTGLPPPFYSGTAGAGALQLVVQDDGNLVLYNGQGQAVWDTGTFGP
jgi:hypothetical protein